MRTSIARSWTSCRQGFAGFSWTCHDMSFVSFFLSSFARDIHVKFYDPFKATHIMTHPLSPSIWFLPPLWLGLSIERSKRFKILIFKANICVTVSYRIWIFCKSIYFMPFRFLLWYVSSCCTSWLHVLLHAFVQLPVFCFWILNEWMRLMKLINILIVFCTRRSMTSG